jgi:hypothetical protein
MTMTDATNVEQNNVLEERNGTFIVTYTGERFWPLDPRTEEIHIEDIAHSLSNCCRYTGHVREFYSIAEHSVRASEIVDPRFAYDMLMHDASEAYLIDVPRPLKALPAFEEYLNIEDSLMYLIAEHFKFNWPMSPEVKEIDNQMLLREWRSLMPISETWLPNPFFEEVIAFECPVIQPWTPWEAEERFLEKFHKLSNH